MEPDLAWGRALAIASAIGALMSGAYYGFGIYEKTRLEAERKQAQQIFENENRKSRCDALVQEQITLNARIRIAKSNRPVGAARIDACLARTDEDLNQCISSYCPGPNWLYGQSCAATSRDLLSLRDQQEDLNRRLCRDLCDGIPKSELAERYSKPCSSVRGIPRLAD